MNKLMLFGVALIMAICFAIIIGGAIAVLQLIFG